ncbi:MAG TPA: hypothetical protein VE441_11675 [Mycobacterium sp.]|nr:hypothetical protein [Mycobacterium sp.]
MSKTRRAGLVRAGRSRSGTRLVGRRIGFAVLLIAFVAAGVQTTRAALTTAAQKGQLETASGNGPFAIGQNVRVDRTVVQVTNVDLLGGLTAHDLANANHGIANQVNADQMQVQVTVRFVNDSKHAIAYPAKQIRLLVGKTAGVAAMSSTIPNGQLPPGAAIEGNLGFVAPRKGGALRLEMPSAHGRILINLGRADSVPASGAEHHH